jgi:lipopolysaccharide transport system ATP-binding protein
MSKSVIQISNISKKFYTHNSPTDFLLEIFGIGKKAFAFDALCDVNFDVSSGEVLAILGRNGAGKSTLLKIIAGTLAPDCGSVVINGKLSAILELGTGFNPDYTGRQNVVMGGLCQGMSRSEILSKEEEIISFSELGDFIDRPFRTYSSGMQARLCFATALACDPGLLVIDEALSVGDIRFQRKCFSHLEKLRALGATILLVSHDMNAVSQICDRAIWLERGKVIAIGNSKEVSEQYLRAILAPQNKSSTNNDKLTESVSIGGNITQEMRYGSGAAFIDYVDLLDECGNSVRIIRPCKNYVIRAGVTACKPLKDLHIGFSIRTVRGLELFAINPRPQNVSPVKLDYGQKVFAEVIFTNYLASGDYFITIGAWGLEDDSHYDRRVDVIHFNVSGNTGSLPQSIVNLCPKYKFIHDLEMT